MRTTTIARLLTVVAASAALWARPASAFVDEIFVTSLGTTEGGGTISAYNSLGGTVNASLATGLHDPYDVVASGPLLVVTNDTAQPISEYMFSGSVVKPRFFFEGLQSPSDIAASGSTLFVASLGLGGTFGGSVGDYTTSGATINSSLIAQLPTPTAIAVSGSNLFVGSEFYSTIGEYTTSGATVNGSLLSAVGPPQSMALSGTNLFVLSPNDSGVGQFIGEYTTAGATTNKSLITGLTSAERMAVSGSDLYVTNYATGTVSEYTTAGATVNASLFTGLTHPVGIAVVHVIPGDVNYDGFVNGQDIALLASHWLQTGDAKSLPGDASYDGIVNGQDIALIAENWLQIAGGGAGSGATVPEPSTLILAALGGLAWLAGQRQLASRAAP